MIRLMTGNGGPLESTRVPFGVRDRLKADRA